MMGKINLDKINNPGLIRTEPQGGVKKSNHEAQIIENKQNVTEDKLDLSNRGSEVNTFIDKLKELPDVRQDKVNSLREQIASGNYNPSSAEIADAILKDEQ